METSLKTLLAEILDLPSDSVTDELAMKDLDVWDSLKHMELIASLEQRLGIELTFEEIVAMKSVGDIKRVLGNRGVAN